MAFDPAPLLQEVPGPTPTGGNLEYAPEFAALERAFAGKPEQQIGATVLAEEPPNWEQVEQLATELLVRSKDLRIAVPLARAFARKRGFEGLTDGLGVIRGLLERYWPALHPELDPDDPTDATMRISALSSLCEAPVIAELRGAPLFQTRSFGAVTLRGTLGADRTALDGPFAEAGQVTLDAAFGGLRDAVGHLGAIEAAFASVSRGPDFAPLLLILRQALALLEPWVKKAAQDEESRHDTGLGPSQGGPAHRGELASREDVQRAIDEICRYYAKHEPSSPLPLLLGRCRRLVTMSFIDIVKDMVPEALTQVRLITGKSEE